MGRLPPLNPVRAPAGVTGMPFSEQYLSVFEISSVLTGFKTTAGKNVRSSVSSWA